MRCFRYFLLSAVGLRVWGVHFNSNACINFFFWYSYYCIGRALLQERRLIKFMNKYFTIIVFIIIIIFGTWFFSTRSSETNVTNLGLKLESENKTIKTMTNATLNTNMGNITIEFFDSQAPKTVANFIKLAKDGFYSGVKFHRVIKGFMIQGGDPLSKDDTKVDSWGMGGPGYSFADEISKENKNDVGTIAMANAGANTNGSQFFINTANNNFLDSKHTVFGKVTTGMEVVRKIENVKTTTADRPVDPVIINSITLK